MPPYGCPPFRRGGVTSKGDMIVTPATLFSQRAEPSPLWLRTLRERPIGRGTTRISRVRCDKAKRGWASRVPLPPGVTARRTGGVLVVRAPPLFGAGAPRGRAKEDRGRDTLCPPCREVALTTVIPAGRRSSRLGSRNRAQRSRAVEEETDHPRDAIEAALAHVVQNQVKAAYARSDLFERRRARKCHSRSGPFFEG